MEKQVKIFGRHKEKSGRTVFAGHVVLSGKWVGKTVKIILRRKK